ncbi:Formamidase [Lentinula boryana]|uniref:Formamidase n=1 Tax=Lentinula boryana TaxID=40481 RepID=A0ABQ8PZD6_9AGAR|nr:Formamidase [Lentinula boryana]
MSIHSVARHQSHLAWDNSIQPILRVKSGDTVKFDCLDASNGQITPDSTVASVASLVFSNLDQVNGPIFVEGAQPGDTLKVEVLSIETADWGWTACIPGFGLLSDEYPEPALKIWKLNKKGGYTYFNEEKGIKIILCPFAGEMGVARKERGPFSTIPPYNTGGNIDTKHITAGSTLYLPIEVEGALFSMGDGHAAQGDGASLGTAIETPIVAELRFSVVKDRPYTRTPHFKTPPVNVSNEEYYCTTGVEPDLREASRAALRHMVQYLGQEYGLDPVEAYMLCSVTGDLRIHEVVDMPNYLVGLMMPSSIFSQQMS